MSKVDDSSDAQRMREMNEAQFRRRADNDARTQQGRLQKSFNQVMTDNGRRAQAQQTAEKAAKEPESSQLAKQVLDKVTKQQSQAPHELARRAALSRAMHGGLTKKADTGAEQLRGAEVGRQQELVTHTESELEHVEKTVRQDDEREVERTEERQSEVEQARQQEGPLAAIGEDERRRDPRQNHGQGRGQDDRKPEGVAEAKGPQGANPVQLPPEVLRQIVNAVYKGVSQDGRTHMQITLKGGLLDGVRLEVRSDGGKVSCEFSNCGRDLGRLLDSAKGGLARGLAKRGLKLQRLAVA